MRQAQRKPSKTLRNLRTLRDKPDRDKNPTGNPAKNNANPPRTESLGQNQIAAIVSDVLAESLVWDIASGQWFVRASVGKPFTELDNETAWARISGQISEVSDKYSSSTVDGVVKFVKTRLAVRRWTTDRNLLPVTNGVLDLRTRKLHPYEQSDRFNWQLPYAYKPDAECPLIEKTLSRMVGSDAELLEFLYSWLLVVLLGRYDVQAFLELVGGGGTGKSTFLRLLTFLVGDENVNSTDLYSLEKNQFETAALYGKRLTVVNDSARFRGEVPVLKSITGGDYIRLERKNQQQRRPFVYKGLVAIAANQPLESSDYSSGLARRRRSMEIGYKLTDTDKAPYRDKEKYPDGFEGALKAQMSGLLNKLLAMDIDAAVKRVAQPGAAMQSQSLKIELETNPLLSWANENLLGCDAGGETRVGDKESAPSDGLYSNYRECVERSGQTPVSLTRFSRALVDSLKSRGVETEKHRSEFTYLIGIRLRRVIDTEQPRLLYVPTGCVEGLSAGDAATADSEGFEECEQATYTASENNEAPEADEITGTEGDF